jgi:hypothetical protein
LISAQSAVDQGSLSYELRKLWVNRRKIIAKTINVAADVVEEPVFAVQRPKPGLAELDGGRQAHRHQQVFIHPDFNEQ